MFQKVYGDHRKSQENSFASAQEELEIAGRGQGCGVKDLGRYTLLRYIYPSRACGKGFALSSADSSTARRARSEEKRKLNSS